MNNDNLRTVEEMDKKVEDLVVSFDETFIKKAIYKPGLPGQSVAALRIMLYQMFMAGLTFNDKSKGVKGPGNEIN